MTKKIQTAYVVGNKLFYGHTSDTSRSAHFHLAVEAWEQMNGKELCQGAYCSLEDAEDASEKLTERITEHARVALTAYVIPDGWKPVTDEIWKTEADGVLRRVGWAVMFRPTRGPLECSCHIPHATGETLEQAMVGALKELEPKKQS